MSSCLTCELITRRDASLAPAWDCIHRSAHWDVVHSYNTALPGWLVLVPRRHIEALHELTPDEATELGALLRQSSAGLQAVTGCVKTYVMQFAEAAEHPHIHFHVVPRMADQPAERRSLGIFGYLGVADQAHVSEAQMNALAEQLRPFFHSGKPTSGGSR